MQDISVTTISFSTHDLNVLLKDWPLFVSQGVGGPWLCLYKIFLILLRLCTI